MTIIFSPEAGAEIEAASAFYTVKSPELKDRFLADIDEALARIEAFPRAWPAVRGDARRCICKTFPYIVIYRLVEGDIRIYAVAHQARRPGYWWKRLRK